MDVQNTLTQHEEKMNKCIEALKRDLASIRTGRASTSLLDRVMVDYYGSPDTGQTGGQRIGTGTAADHHCSLGTEHAERNRKSHPQIRSGPQPEQ